jgi:NADPH:quinone reductase-like Zn-dependent oxidoreductase
MKAIVVERYGPPDVLQLKEVEEPTPKDNEVLIRIYAAAVNAAEPVDRNGEPFIERSATGLIKLKNSITGDVLAGEIEAVGKNVKLFKKGDQVFGATGIGSGAYAEYICLPEKPEQHSGVFWSRLCSGTLPLYQYS